MSIASGFDRLRAGEGYIHIHGHRGARGILPENTLDSFRFAFDIGVRIVELDVLMSADNIPVLTHNPHLLADSTRDADGEWLSDEAPLVRSFNLAELQKFDVGGLKPGSEYAARFPEQAFRNGEKIPTLADLCMLVNEPGYQDVWLNIEIKSTPNCPECTPPPGEYVAAVMQVIEQHQLQERIILQSFDWRIVHECAQQAPTIPRSYLTYAPVTGGAPEEINVYKESPWMDGLMLADHGDSLPKLIANAGGQIWAPYHEDLTEEAMTVARQHGLMVNVWTVNEIQDIDRMVALGVDGIITDYPGRVQRRLMDHGLGWLADQSLNGAV